MTSRGLLHVHSTCSYDGQHSLDEIVRYASTRGIDFVAMSEHSDGLDQSTFDRYVRECADRTTPACLVIPGVEFSCRGDVHILGFGVARLTSERDPVAVADFVRRQGGVAVVAHPSRYDYQLPDGLAEAVDGLEVWNACYDGRFVPNPKSLALLEDVRTKQAGAKAFGGQDLHRIHLGHQFPVTLVLSSACQEVAGILSAMRGGAFRVSNGYVAVLADASHGWSRRAALTVLSGSYMAARGLRESLWGSRD